MNKFSVIAMCLLLLTSCVSNKKYAALEEESNNQANQLRSNLSDCTGELGDIKGQLSSLEHQLEQCNTAVINETDKVKNLEDQLAFVKETNTNLLARLSDLSIVSVSGAESIKASLETMNRQNSYIRNLNTSIQRKDSINMALVMKLKRSLGDINDDDIQIEVKKGVVYISLSDKLLFNSGSAVINAKAQEVLGKIAKVVNDHKTFDILVEGHTDAVPMSTDCITDNWDLSVKRATSVVRTLQNKYDVDPARMTAGGRSEYLPKDDNDSASGRSHNRRTEILVIPKLDQFFDLLAEPLDGVE